MTLEWFQIEFCVFFASSSSSFSLFSDDFYWIAAFYDHSSARCTATINKTKRKMPMAHVRFIISVNDFTIFQMWTRSLSQWRPYRILVSALLSRLQAVTQINSFHQWNVVMISLMILCYNFYKKNRIQFKAFKKSDSQCQISVRIFAFLQYFDKLSPQPWLTGCSIESDFFSHSLAAHTQSHSYNHTHVYMHTHTDPHSHSDVTISLQPSSSVSGWLQFATLFILYPSQSLHSRPPLFVTNGRLLLMMLWSLPVCVCVCLRVYTYLCAAKLHESKIMNRNRKHGVS